jgi:glycosyltransferase involved in cell wall biosynthesis
MKTELVSIITANYNAAKYISDTIESVLAQSYDNWEMIIVDDCSSDNSIEIIESYIAKDSRIKLVQLEQNSGAAVARNRAIELAQGRFIAFLDSDDLWQSDKLEKQISFMLKNGYIFSYSHYDLIDEDNKRYGITFKAPPKVSYNDLLKTCSIGCLTAIYDTKSLGKVTMPLILKRQDYGLWLKILKKIDYAYCYDESLAIYRTRTNSISSNKIKAAQYQWKIYRDVEKLGIFKSIFYFIHYVYNGLRKYR